MRATGRDHVCGAPLVIDTADAHPRCAVCRASDPSWDATTRTQAITPPPSTHPYGLFHGLVDDVMAATWPPSTLSGRRRHRRRQETT